MKLKGVFLIEDGRFYFEFYGNKRLSAATMSELEQLILDFNSVYNETTGLTFTPRDVEISMEDTQIVAA